MRTRTSIIVLVWFTVLLLFVSSLVLAMGLKEEKQVISEPTTVKLYVYGKGLLELDLEEYLIGVVAAEMPASFHEEALKSQAIAARTYILKRLDSIEKNGSKYPLGADITNLPQEGQAWLSSEEQQEKWQSGFLVNRKKIASAVYATQGQVLSYQGALAEALYCSTAGPYTEDAQAVFNSQAPYLKAQPNPFDKHSPRYTDKKTLTIAELERALGVKLNPKELVLATRVPQGPEVIMAATLLVPWSNPEKSNSAMKILSRNRSGRVEQLLVGGKIFNGTDVRSKLGLRSTNFTFEISASGQSVTFHTYGYGHGVGMSQYGADGMAREGYSYMDILNFYYPGTKVVSIDEIFGHN